MRKPGLLHEGVPQNVIKPKRLQRGRTAACDALREQESVIQLPDLLPRGRGRGDSRAAPVRFGGDKPYPCHPTNNGFASRWVVSVGKHIPHNMKGCVF